MPSQSIMRMYAPGASSNAITAESVSGLFVADTNLGSSLCMTVCTFVNMAVALTDEAGVVAYGGKKLFTFPAGQILVLGANANIALTKSSAGVNTDWDGDFGVGTITAGNNNALATTEQNILPTTATPQAVAGATTSNGNNAAVAFLDGTSTAAPVFINYLIDDADHNVTGTACNLILNGTLTIIWLNMGDY